MKYKKCISVLVLFLFGINTVLAFDDDEYFQAYSQIISNKPDGEKELMALVSDSDVLSESSSLASVYIALLQSTVNHPTGFEEYKLAPKDHVQDVKRSHPSLYFRHNILLAYNFAIQEQWRLAHSKIDEIIAFANGNDTELYFDAIATKSIFLARMGLIRASLNSSAKILGELPSLTEKRFFGDGAIENMELVIGLNMSYLGENKRALELCSRVETFFITRPLASPHRYYQIALDCQRRSLENLNQPDKAFDTLERYIEYATSIEDWDTYTYGLVLKVEYLYALDKVKEAHKLIEKTESFISSLPTSYDTNTYQISRFKALVEQGDVERANALSAIIADNLSDDYSSPDLHWAQFKSIQSSLFEQLGNKDAAISALRDSKNFYQTLYYQTDDRKELFSDYYESALAERKLQLLEQQHELSQLELANSNRVNLILTAGALTLLGLLVLISYLYAVQRRLKREQETLATVDTLTGVRNRRSLLGVIQLELNEAKAYQNDLSLVLIDLDNFKAINDNYGHECGDNLLKAFCEHVSKSIRKTDTFGRYGGEEFILCLPKTSASEAKKVVNSILNSYRKVRISPDIGAQTFSAGIAQYQKGIETSKLIKQCDDALYVAKRFGRNRVCIFSHDD
ncbi:GGDEF domain-containing protein [Alteromonas portus]|uniref:GGDEF domain-containing protein n=1 Tax=Alteromonas portus TaxID=2565549 RepID=UPI003BF8CDC5